MNLEYTFRSPSGVFTVTAPNFQSAAAQLPERARGPYTVTESPAHIIATRNPLQMLPRPI